jgi:hypothetical protein
MPKLEMVKDGHLGGYIRGGDPGSWCPHLWSWAVRRLDVHSVLDVGCGEAHSTRFFHELGCEASGVDGCEEALRDSVLPAHVLKHDFAEGPFLPPRCADLVWSCEFLEHVEERYLVNLRHTFASARKAILVTHAFPGQDRGHHHVNCRPSAYWIRWFEQLGFRCDASLSRQARAVTLRDYPGVNHFARSGLVFLRDTLPPDRIDAPLSAAKLSPWRRLQAAWKGFSINTGFALSPRLLVHRCRRKMRKRAARAA